MSGRTITSVSPARAVVISEPLVVLFLLFDDLEILIEGYVILAVLARRVVCEVDVALRTRTAPT